MNLSHTGFSNWESRESLFQPIHFQGDKQEAINFSEILL